jgi:flagellin-specific chaperone FliS
LWDDPEQALEVDRLVRRTLGVVEELVHSVSAGRTEASTRLEEEYAFIYRQISTVHLDHDAAKLDAALELLDYQRDTWRLACEQLRAQLPPAAQVTANQAPSSGFSCQA